MSLYEWVPCIVQCYENVFALFLFIYLWIMAQMSSPKALKNGLVALSRQIHISDFVSHLLLNFFWSQHDAFWDLWASLCWSVRFTVSHFTCILLKKYVFFFFLSRQAKLVCVFSVQGWRWRKKSLRVGSVGCGTGEESLHSQKMSRLEVGPTK